MSSCFWSQRQFPARSWDPRASFAYCHPPVHWLGQSRDSSCVAGKSVRVTVFHAPSAPDDGAPAFSSIFGL
ncbi:hypothetical protein ACOMHN_041379 [Nucella lapillus]